MALQPSLQLKDAKHTTPCIKAAFNHCLGIEHTLMVGRGRERRGGDADVAKSALFHLLWFSPVMFFSCKQK